MVLANPANRVNEVMALRAPSPYILPSVENAASVRPEPIPTPISSHAARYQTMLCDNPSDKSPSANKTALMAKMTLPPLLPSHARFAVR